MGVDDYLSEPEIAKITGRVYAKWQVRVLTERGWPFEVDGDGRPLVLRSVRDERMGIRPAKVRRGPRLEGLASA